MGLSRLVPVKQRFVDRACGDVSGAVRTTLREKGIGAGLRPGARVAITAGSRGISNIALIVRETAAHFRDLGLKPFIVPAMGSHGGGTAEGQRLVLAHYGITEESAGCPIHSSLEIVRLGQTATGLETYMDRLAFESEGVFLVNRVKWHTTFDAPIESGLLKMAVIGLGKLEGAADYHRYVVRRGFGAVIEEAGRHVVGSGKVMGGLAIVEDALHQTAHVEALLAEEIPEQEPRILKLAKSWMPRLPFDEIDVLIVDEIGKQISGVGMDSKVVNRHPYGAINPWDYLPRILRIYVRSLSPQSYGNANGLGMADVISERLYQDVDWEATRTNALTANNFPCQRVPLRAPNDADALRLVANSVGRLAQEEVTVVWIRNTLELGRFLATENLLPSARIDAGVEAAGAAQEWQFDAAGNLTLDLAGALAKGA
jgi:hypothetical protein